MLLPNNPFIGSLRIGIACCKQLLCLPVILWAGFLLLWVLYEGCVAVVQKDIFEVMVKLNTLFLVALYMTSFTAIGAEDLTSQTNTNQTKPIQIGAKQIEAKQSKGMKLTPAFDFELILLHDEVIFTDLAKKTTLLNSSKIQKILGFDIQGGLKMQWLSFSLLPYLQYQNKGLKNKLECYSLAVGANINITKVKNLMLGFDLAYLGEIQRSWGKTFSGFRIKNEIKYNLNSLFLLHALNEFTLLANMTDKVNKKIDEDILSNHFAVEVVFNFFNFFKQGINSGLYIREEVDVVWKRKKIATNVSYFDNPIDNYLGFGFIFNPIEYFRAKTGIIYRASPIYKRLNKSITNYGVIQSLGWLFSVSLKYQKVSLNFEYHPYFYSISYNEPLLVHHIYLNLKYSL